MKRLLWRDLCLEFSRGRCVELRNGRERHSRNNVCCGWCRTRCDTVTAARPATVAALIIVVIISIIIIVDVVVIVLIIIFISIIIVIIRIIIVVAVGSERFHFHNSGVARATGHVTAAARSAVADIVVDIIVIVVVIVSAEFVTARRSTDVP